jgi:hypothetical protein
MKLLVCGGRHFSDAERMNRTLDAVHKKRGVDLVIHGGAGGADTLALWWAKSRGIPARCFPADWNTHGRAAGPIRNQQMIDEGLPDGVVAFPGHRGTVDMVKRAKSAGLVVWEIH